LLGVSYNNREEINELVYGRKHQRRKTKKGNNKKEGGRSPEKRATIRNRSGKRATKLEGWQAPARARHSCEEERHARK
jgi:hypothetical protein